MIEEILFGGADSRPRTIVSIQSVSLGGLTSRYLRGLNYFEERNFYFIDLLRNRNCGCVAVLSDDIDNRFFEHAMHEGARACNLDPGDIARRWKTLFVPTDGRSSLSELLLRNPHALGWLREILARCENPILDFWTVSEHEIQLANALGLPHFGLREEFLSIDSKSNGRAIFELLKIRHPRGRQNIHSVDDAQRALADLSSGSDARSFLIKLNCEEAGNGIARVQRSVVGESRDKFIAHLEISKKIPLEAFVSQIGRQGAVVEECIEAPITSFPSVKMNVLPDGQVVNLATHDQVLTGMAYSGSRFPANEEYRKELIARGYEIAAYLAAKGVRGMVSVDFIATRERATEPWTVWGLEINARKGATTHPYLWTRLLTDATYDEPTGRLNSRSGQIKYRSSEYVQADGLENVSPHALLNAIRDAGLAFDHATQRGVFVHMATSLRGFSKFGATFVGHSDPEIDQLHARVVQLAQQLANQRKRSHPRMSSG